LRVVLPDAGRGASRDGRSGSGEDDYARVFTEEQAKSDYTLAKHLEALAGHATAAFTLLRDTHHYESSARRTANAMDVNFPGIL
jgi:hypothetical protein